MVLFLLVWLFKIIKQNIKQQTVSITFTVYKL